MRDAAHARKSANSSAMLYGNEGNDLSIVFGRVHLLHSAVGARIVMGIGKKGVFILFLLEVGLEKASLELP